MKLIYQEVEAKAVIGSFAEKFRFPEGESLHKAEFYFDPKASVIVFKLYVNEKGDAPTVVEGVKPVEGSSE